MKPIPNDLSEVPEGKLTVAMLDENFDATRDNFTETDTRLVSLQRQLEESGKEIARLGRVIQKLVDSKAERAHAEHQAPKGKRK